MSGLMGCGHPASAVVTDGEGTSFCGECACAFASERDEAVRLLRDTGHVDWNRCVREFLERFDGEA